VNLVSLEKVVKGYGQRRLLDGVSAGVAAGERIGVVGRNGAGKSTLLALLAGAEQPDDGRITRARGLRVGRLAQQDRLTGTVGELVTGGRPEHEWAGDPRTRSAVAALLPGIDFKSGAERLSGGESRRVALAALLLGEHDLLLLDEPTNHLDVEAVDWLARFLAGLAAAQVVVTHDRWFLDAVCERTWELADGQLHAYDGGYAAYVLARAERARLADAAQRRRRSLLRKELAWLRRGPPARTSKPRFRIEAANALIAGEPAARDGVELARLATARLGKTVLDAQDLTVRAGERVLLDHVTWQLGPGDRIGVLGPNGAGKTSLLRVLAGEGIGREDGSADSAAETPIRPSRAPRPAGSGVTGEGSVRGEPRPGQAARAGVVVTGRVVRGKTVRLGYLAQDDAPVDPGLSAREVVTQVRGNLAASEGAGSAGQLLERLGLRGDTQFTPAGELSGGERRRVQVLALLVDEPNVLLLDEPTNDLDVDTLTELEDLLDGWPGSLLVVSHDRYFLERVTDHVVALLGDGKLSYLGGGVEEYLARRAAPPAAQPEARPAGRAGGRPAGDGAGPGAAGAERAARKELQRLERQIDRLTTREAELSAELAAQASDYQKLIDLGAQLRSVQQDKARLEEQWLTVAAELPG
jgi:ABC transport system ATP-binding/permease protein